MSLVRGLTEVGAKAVKKTAPFYSAVDEALANLKRPKGTGIEFLTEVLKQPGVKKAEIADRKLEEAFKAKGKMTKEEAQQVLKENPPPKLQERVIDDSQRLEEEELRDIVSEEMYGMPYDRLDNNRARGRVFDEAFRRMGEENGPMYGDYKTPGGKNYREILLKLPSRRPNASNYTDPAKYDADMRLFNSSGKSDYQSGHWKEDPNVLAHMRVQDRTGPNGEKILHVEEIQSDWHQEGRKKGYSSGDAMKAYADYEQGLKPRTLDKITQMFIESGTEPERAQILAAKQLENILSMSKEKLLGPSNMAKILDEEDTINSLWKAATAEKGKIPDAPFKKNWHELAMKRLLNYAADNGYDSIAITPGAEQAKRYSLAKQLDEVQFDPNTGYLAGRDHDGKLVVAQKGVTAETLEDYIGKEGAQKILQAPIDETGVHALRGADLEVGGEGMKGFYDKMLPDYLNTFGKPYGAEVEMNKFPVSTRSPNDTSWSGGQGDHPFITVQDINEPFYGMVELMQRHPETGEETLVGRMLRGDSERRMAEELMKLDTVNQTKLHQFPITPEMRESIKQKGLPLYQQVGIPTAGAGAASQTTQEEPEYGVGGSVAKMAALAKLQKLKEEMAPRAAVVKDLMAKDSNQYLRDVTPDVLTNDYIEQEIARMKAKAEASKPEVKLADGGAINFNTAPDMSDGGRIIEGAPFKRGGKVNMTANRDTMFMELSNKKLKRK